MTYAIISATENDLYSYPLPIVVWSWYKIGIKSIVFVPKSSGDKIELAKRYCDGMADFYTFDCEERKEATYSQTSRLFGATIGGLNDNDILICGDSDLAVFSNIFEQFKDEEVRVIGADLLAPEMNQFPMCFIGMPVHKWKDIFDLHNKTLQQALDETVGQLQSISFRGDFWGYDQWYAHKKIVESGVNVLKNSRAKMPERFACYRIDRDDFYWEEKLNQPIIDAHLWRPLYTPENFNKLEKLLRYFYPLEDFSWLIDYTKKYITLL